MKLDPRRFVLPKGWVKTRAQREAVRAMAAVERKAPAFMKAGKEHWAAHRPGSAQGNWRLGWRLLGRSGHIADDVWDEWGGHMYATLDGAKAHVAGFSAPDNAVFKHLKRLSHPRFGGKKRKPAMQAMYYIGPAAFRDAQDRSGRLTREAVITRAREIDEWAVSDEPAAVLFREIAYKGKEPRDHIPDWAELCDRCSGIGVIDGFRHVDGGVCFDCGGSGLVEKR